MSIDKGVYCSMLQPLLARGLPLAQGNSQDACVCPWIPVGAGMTEGEIMHVRTLWSPPPRV